MLRDYGREVVDMVPQIIELVMQTLQLAGDAMGAAVRVRPDGASFSNRYVKSAAYLAEQAAGRRLFGTVGTQAPGTICAGPLGSDGPPG